MSKKLIEFNATAYMTAVGKQLKVANQDIRKDILDSMKENLKDITFKNNPVEMAGGRVTSDRERRSALFQSLATERADWVTKTYLSSAITAMKTNFKDSHIGLYYEYGTGTKNKTSDYESFGDWNPFRIHNTGASIVSRSKHVGTYFTNDDKSIWMDVGGNARVTGSWTGGRNDAKFRSYIGEDVKAYGWFSKAVMNDYVLKRAKKHIIKAFTSVDIQEYFIVAPKFTLGLD